MAFSFQKAGWSRGSRWECFLSSSFHTSLDLSSFLDPYSKSQTLFSWCYVSPVIQFLLFSVRVWQRETGDWHSFQAIDLWYINSWMTESRLGSPPAGEPEDILLRNNALPATVGWRTKRLVDMDSCSMIVWNWNCPATSPAWGHLCLSIAGDRKSWSTSAQRFESWSGARSQVLPLSLKQFFKEERSTRKDMSEGTKKQ